MNVLLQDLVTAQAEHRWDSPALQGSDRAVTYGEIEQRSNQLAHVLLEAGCRRGDRVGVASDETIPGVIAMLGIYKADCTCAVLDTTAGPGQLAAVLQLSAPACILSTRSGIGPLSEALQRLQPDLQAPLGSLDPAPLEHEAGRSVFSMADVMSVPGQPLGYRNWPEDPAQIVFRAGPNGTPLGVVLTHSNVRQYVLWAGHYFGVLPADRHSAHAPVHSGLALADIFSGLAAGAVLYPVPDAARRSPADLAGFIRASELTQWCSSPEVLIEMASADVVDLNDFPRLRRIVWSGAGFAIAALRYWMDRLPHVMFTGLYGVPETTIASGYYTVSEYPGDEASLPIGQARPGEELLVLDERLEPLPRGATGRIFVRGTGVAAGYWRDPASTQAAFLVNPHTADPADRLYQTGDFGRLDEDGLLYVATPHVAQGTLMALRGTNR